MEKLMEVNEWMIYLEKSCMGLKIFNMNWMANYIFLHIIKMKVQKKHDVFRI